MTINASDMNAPVGTLAKKDYTALSDSWTVGQALESLRRADLGEAIIYFYVVDAQGKLVGVVPTRRLLMAQPTERLAEIMIGHVVSVAQSMTVLEACDFFIMYRLLAFPVVDDQGRIVGVIDVSLFTDEVFSLAKSRADQNVFQLIGVHVARGRKRTAWSGFRSRFPWLLCNIAGGIGCALLVGQYEAFLDSVIVLALFIPVVLALGESVSIQSMSLTLQSLYAASIDWRSLARALQAEVLTALLLGGACGILVGSVGWAWRGSFGVAAAIAASICLSIVTACVLGVALPTIIRALKGNPRIAAGPVVLALADILTLLFYFSLAGLILA
ncbi:MAG: magnesium transporter [Planctomycetaceae bacterium]|nr:magnesium transporter [Planctomycetaceae bacterium]